MRSKSGYREQQQRKDCDLIMKCTVFVERLSFKHNGWYQLYFSGCFAEK